MELRDITEEDLKDLSDGEIEAGYYWLSRIGDKLVERSSYIRDKTAGYIGDPHEVEMSERDLRELKDLRNLSDCIGGLYGLMEWYEFEMDERGIDLPSSLAYNY
ncbi:MAG: hypothetical protein KJ600_01800 [Nanoarchaeota archaeon]|nr:hypothetical protein [Nanoarchaeota archaeon]MBU1103271.1 hypothetical protein [Nanoarchaeota archaeon]